MTCSAGNPNCAFTSTKPEYCPECGEIIAYRCIGCGAIVPGSEKDCKC